MKFNNITDVDRIFEQYRNSPQMRRLMGNYRPGRNDECPCGSGKKYKKCCSPRYDDGIPLDENEQKQEKFSDILYRFAEPILAEAKGEKEMRNAICYAAMVWNYCIAQDDEKALLGAMIKIAELSKKDYPKKFVNKFQILVDSKQREFSEDRYNVRYLKHDVVFNSNGDMVIFVAAVPVGKKQHSKDNVPAE